MEIETKATITMTFDMETEEKLYREVKSVRPAFDLIWDIYKAAMNGGRDRDLGVDPAKACDEIVGLIIAYLPSFYPRGGG